MPNENENVPVVVPDPRDAKIKALEGQVATLSKDLQKAEKQTATLTADLDQAEKKLKSAKSAPQGDCVFLGGKTYGIDRMVAARFATDEARKGYIDLDEELIVVKRNG